MFPKTKRIEDKEIMKKVSKMPCAVCKRRPPSDPHHIKTRGSGGDDVEANLIALCREHHTEIHTIGPGKFLSRYPHVALRFNDQFN